MRKTPGLIAAAAGVLVILCVPSLVSGQVARAVGPVASLAPGTIQGLVLDESGAPVAGAVVSALGSSSAFAVTDRFGHFELRSLQPGPYVVRAHLAGYVAPRGQVVRVLPSTRSSSSIALRRVTVLASTSTPPIVPAALGPLPAPDTATPRADDAVVRDASSGDSTDVAWRPARQAQHSERRRSGDRRNQRVGGRQQLRHAACIQPRGRSSAQLAPRFTDTRSSGS